jgi:twitching motility protein PilT
VQRIAYGTMTDKQKREFEECLQLDYGFMMPGLARFRANVFMQKGSIAIVVRKVPLDIPALEGLGLPAVLQELALKPRGLVLVTGATGSGKSTTLTAMIDFINRNRRAHIITIEDPIEFVHEDRQSTLSQREVGSDTMNMSDALRAALRQDPDVIMIGEMRDYATMQVAITAAETGHLVLSTLHTNSAAKSIDRIMDSFPAEAKNQVRMQLASSLCGVVTQQLIRRNDGKGMVAACEVMVKSPTIEKLILDNKVGEILTSIEASGLYYKMQSMNQAIEALIKAGTITKEEGVHHSDRKEDLLLKLSGMVGGGQAGVDAASIMSQAAPADEPAVESYAPDVSEIIPSAPVTNGISGIEVVDPKMGKWIPPKKKVG